MESIQQQPMPVSRRQWALFFVLLLCFLGWVGHQLWQLHQVGGAFWDAQVYARAIGAYRAGGEPYAHFAQLNFVSTPLFLRLGSLLTGWIGLNVLGSLYLAATCCATVLLPVVIARGYIRSSWLTLPVAFAIFACHPLMSGEVAFESGNVSDLLYTLILAAGIPGVRRNRWGWFFVALVVASILKPPFLAFLLLPLLLGKGQRVASLLAAGAVLVEMVVERWMWPELYRAFLDSVLFQVTVLQDTGIGLVRYFIHFHLGGGIPVLGDHLGYVMHCLVMAGMLAGFWVLRRRGDAVPNPVFVAVAMLMAVIANPRIQDYDLAVAVIPATFLLIESTKALLFPRPGLLAVIPGVLAFGVLLWRSASPAMFSYLLVSALLVLLWGYRRRTTPPPSYG